MAAMRNIENMGMALTKMVASFSALIGKNKRHRRGKYTLRDGAPGAVACARSSTSKPPCAHGVATMPSCALKLARLAALIWAATSPCMRKSNSHNQTSLKISASATIRATLKYRPAPTRLASC